MNPRHCWFNNAITDPAIFSGTLLHCAGHYAFFYEFPDLSECFFLLGETTRMVNSNLRNPEKAIGDVNIAAVTALAFFEVVTSLLTKLLSWQDEKLNYADFLEHSW